MPGEIQGAFCKTQLLSIILQLGSAAGCNTHLINSARCEADVTSAHAEPALQMLNVYEHIYEMIL